jgi:hypothetical protein
VFTESTSERKTPSYDVKIRGENFTTRGRYAIHALESPSHKKAAILTADGPIDSVGWFAIFGLGWGQPYVNGKRYVEIIEVGKPEFLQEPLVLLNSESKEVFPLCWSADDHYLVAYKYNYENFSVIETEATGK